MRLAMYGVSLEERPELSSLYIWARTDAGFVHMFLHALRTPAYKFVRITLVDAKGDVSVPTFVYFDLVEDPAELEGIGDISDPRVAGAWRDLEAELDGVRLSWEGAPKSPEGARILEAEFEWAEELVALGYALPNEAGSQSPLKHLASGLTPLPRMDPPETAAAPEPARLSWRRVSLAAGSLLVFAVVGAGLWRRSRSAADP